MRDPRLTEIELLMDLEVRGTLTITSTMQDRNSHAVNGNAYRTRYDLDPGRFRDLVLGLLMSGAIVGHACHREGHTQTCVLEMERQEMFETLMAGQPTTVLLSHAGRVRLWELRDLLLRDPDAEPMGLLSKAAWERHLPVQLQWASAEEPLAIIFLDLDNFGAINKELGSAVGDDVLRATFALTKNLVGSRGNVFRFGGEEVGILLPKHPLDAACAVAEELRAAVESGVRGRVPQLDRTQTASIGVAAFTTRTEPRVALERVDGLMREAKRAGKNRVVAPSLSEPG